MLSGSFSIFKWPGTPLGPSEYLEVFVGTIQLVSCQDIVTLTGTVLSDPTGHTYYWEQTAGPAVTWLEPQNQLDVTFQKPAVFVDLIFRLWIDRYTPFQQYKDVIVTGVARDDFTSALNSGVAGSSTASLPGVSNPYIIPGPAAAGSVSLNNTTRTLVWTNPSAPSGSTYTKHEIYRVTGSTLTLLATLDFIATSYSNPGIGVPSITEIYVIRTYYTISGVLDGYVDVPAPGFPYDTSITTLDGTDNFGNYQFANAQGSGEYFQTQILTLFTLDAGSDTYTNTALNTGVPGVADYVQTQILTLAVLPGDPTDTFTNAALNTGVPGVAALFQVQLSDGITVIG